VFKQLKNDGMAELDTGGSGERGIILSKRAGETHYLFSKTATYIDSRKRSNETI